MQPELKPVPSGEPGSSAPYGALGGTAIAPEAQKVLRNTYLLLALTMVPTVGGAYLGMATSGIITQHPIISFFVMLGAVIGLPIAQTPEERHAVTRKLGSFRTSMLQDLQAGRPLEIDALVGAVHEIGLHLGLVTPNIDALLGLVRLMASERGLYGPPTAA